VIFGVVDRFTKYAHFIPLSHPFTASDIAQTFMENVYKLHGLPLTIITNRDLIFTSQFWRALMKILGIKLNMSTAYYPQTDGQTKRVNKCLENYLRAMVFAEQKEWMKYLPMAEYWYNTSHHSALQTTQFQALYGCTATSIASGNVPRSSVETVNQTISNYHKTVVELKENLHRTQERMKFFADNKKKLKENFKKEIGSI
jgi:hypothetical protein